MEVTTIQCQRTQNQGDILGHAIASPLCKNIRWLHSGGLECQSAVPFSTLLDRRLSLNPPAWAYVQCGGLVNNPKTGIAVSAVVCYNYSLTTG